MTIVGAFVVGMILIVTLSALLAFPVMWLWNYVIPDLFKVPELTFWKSWALMVLCGFLFKSTGTNSSKD